ncbi:hypothetical protein B586_14290 [Mycobacterium haemophilum DSM 44634]|uniref:hypothetical protein n=1 Tax=Mycobacterium haemophilum TaxID=29311 RepID=UPI00065625C7|nr:hypothetical protein [Mycobacterium haemophilum]AKN17479.1 hypothetical protein B586_14290 [Mycobacterium haemophilum DSM 44634]MCV7341602.1 hypothetical protein [Mycobacterium haemophilum DSM 44634]
MKEQQESPEVRRLRSELLQRLDETPFNDCSPALLRALIAVFDLELGNTPAAPNAQTKPNLRVVR